MYKPQYNVIITKYVTTSHLEIQMDQITMTPIS